MDDKVETKRAELLALTEDKDIFEFFGREYKEGAEILDARKAYWYMDDCQVLYSSNDCEFDRGFLIAQIVTGHIENYIEDERTKDFCCSNLDLDAEQTILEMPVTIDGRDTKLYVGALIQLDHGVYLCLGGGRITFPTEEELHESGYHCDECGIDYRAEEHDDRNSETET